jgi:hypothetical protein
MRDKKQNGAKQGQWRLVMHRVAGDSSKITK